MEILSITEQMNIFGGTNQQFDSAGYSFGQAVGKAVGKVIMGILTMRGLGAF